MPGGPCGCLRGRVGHCGLIRYGEGLGALCGLLVRVLTRGGPGGLPALRDRVLAAQQPAADVVRGPQREAGALDDGPQGKGGVPGQQCRGVDAFGGPVERMGPAVGSRTYVQQRRTRS